MRALRSTEHWWIVFGVASVVAVVAGAIASGGKVPGWEEEIFDAINGLPDWLEGPMWIFQLAGLLFVPLAVAAVAVLLRRWRLAAAMLCAVLPGRWLWVPVVVAVLDAIARVYLGAHNPLDVLGGGAIGVAIGALLVLIFDPGETRSRRRQSSVVDGGAAHVA
jgi:hypothetical protein